MLTFILRSIMDDHKTEKRLRISDKRILKSYDPVRDTDNEGAALDSSFFVGFF